MVDYTGRQVLPPRFEDVEESEGVLQGLEDGRWGLVGEGGGWKLKPQFDSCCEFRDGLALARRGEDDPVGMVDRSGNWAIPPRFKGLSIFQDGLARAWEGEPPTTSGRLYRSRWELGDSAGFRLGQRFFGRPGTRLSPRPPRQPWIAAVTVSLIVVGIGSSLWLGTLNRRSSKTAWRR